MDRAGGRATIRRLDDGTEISLGITEPTGIPLHEKEPTP
jgi:hypothetical protein